MFRFIPAEAGIIVRILLLRNSQFTEPYINRLGVAFIEKGFVF